jgi:hypothetical protein
MNNKKSPDMRVLLRRMRGEEYVKNESENKINKDLNMRDMLKITRKLNEATPQNKKTAYDQKTEEEKFRTFFDDINVDIKFIELEVFNNLIFWGGTIDGVIQFIYKVTPDDSTSGVEFNYLEDFSSDNPENQNIIDKVKSYYDIFYKYWRDNMLK